VDDFERVGALLQPVESSGLSNLTAEELVALARESYIGQIAAAGPPPCGTPGPRDTVLGRGSGGPVFEEFELDVVRIAEGHDCRAERVVVKVGGDPSRAERGGEPV
jgi:hypothetical protein